MQRIKDWWKQLFHKEVLLDPLNNGFMLWIERRDVGWSLFIPEDCLLFIAKQLNEVKTVGVSYKLTLASPDAAEAIPIPRWAFNEARRLITLRVLEGSK